MSQDQSHTDWRAAYEHFASATRKHASVSAQLDHAIAAVAAEAPVPEELKNYGSSLQGMTAIERSISNDQRLSFDRKAELISALRRWKEAEAISAARYEYERLLAAVETDETADAAYEALVDVPPSSLNALADKLRAILNRLVTNLAGEHADDQHAVSRVLTESSQYDAEYALVTVYRDVLRLAGQNTPAISAAPFDAAAWVSDFERLPGHEISRFGPSYTDEAFKGGISDKDFLVSDPAMIASARGRLRELNPDYIAEREALDPDYMTRPFVAGDGFRFDELLADYPKEAERMKALHKARKAAREAGPIGRARWTALTPWQKGAVCSFARARSNA